ncbi:hypothetical protein [Acrocarpospora catenulata]|uniref:hypothetical protein n=1 Tax=Acrocarpospora catenulata TaxID=2836182 RepID=UPI001BD9C092|nr:hypothetical protein [Acrocarpospora catenulata]
MRGSVFFRRGGALVVSAVAGPLMMCGAYAADRGHLDGAATAAEGATEGITVDGLRGDPRDVSNWGTVLTSTGCVQADAWVARLKGLNGFLNTTLFPAHYPEHGQTHASAVGRRMVDLKVPDPTGLTSGLSFGEASGFYARAVGHAVPARRGGEQAVPCAAYAEVGGAVFDVGLPSLPSVGLLASATGTGGGLLNQATPFRPGRSPAWAELRDSSPVRIHLEDVAVSARSVPGKPVRLTSGVSGGFLATYGTKILHFPAKWPANLGFELPTPYGAPLGVVTTNEQITVNPNGTATLTPGRSAYEQNPAAPGGYVNAVHLSVLGTNAADLTVGHAAVLNRTPVSADQTVVFPCVPPSVQETDCEHARR